MRALVVINPLSGRGRLHDHIAADAAMAIDVLAAHGYETTVHITRGPGDANRVAREAVDRGVDLVVGWGGDGTINETASAVIHRGVPLGIVPAGSGNGLACDLGLPFNGRAALTIAATGADFAIDAGQIDESLFFNIAGIGVDAIIATRFQERGLKRRGPLGYLQTGVAELMRYQSQSYRFTIEDQHSEQRAMLIALANGRQYGNRVQIAPGARLDDGLLELVVVEHLSTLSIALRLPSLFRGTLRPGRGVTMRAIREMIICAGAPIPFHVDGEPRLGPTELRVSVHPRSLIVKVARVR